jgi:hypothetical protein
MVTGDRPSSLRRGAQAQVGSLAGPLPRPVTDQLRPAPQTFPTKGEAGRWLSLLEADMLRGTWVDPAEGEMRFDELAERWYATKIHLRATTKLQYRYLLDKHVLPFFGQRPIGSITVLDMQTWLADRHANAKLCANSVAKAYKVLRMVMDVAVDAGLILRTPCRVKGAATERLPEMQAATPEQVAKQTHSHRAVTPPA